MSDALLIDAVRTPMGRRKGMLAGWHPADLLSEVLTAAVRRAGIDPGEVDDVIVGCLDQVGEQGVNIARSAVLGAGFPESVPATTVDRQCGSSQQAAHFAAQGVMAGAYDIVIAAGVESMTRVPMWANAPDPAAAYGPRFRERYSLAPDVLIDQGLSGELVAERWEISREELDEFALSSHVRAAAATDEGRFADEILPLQAARNGDRWIATADEGIRPGSSLEALAGLQPVFREDGRLTAGNSSQISDGAAAVVIASEAAVARLGLRPRARFHSFALAGVDPIEGLSGPHPEHPQGARAGGPGARGHRPGRGERGLRLGAAGVGAGARGRPRARQRQRRRHRPRPPAGVQRRPHHDHPRPRDGPQARALRAADHVRGRRDGQRHHPRARELVEH